MLFPELNSFVFFSKKDVTAFMKDVLDDNNVLKYLRENDGGALVENRKVLPVFGVDDGFYSFEIFVNDGVGSNNIGLFSSSGSLSVSGLGYFVELDVELLEQNKKILSFEVPQGVLKLSYSINLIDEIFTVYVNV